MSPSTSGLGEFGLIERLISTLEARASVAVGPGDDAAVMTTPAGDRIVVTVDALHEAIHFDLALSSYEDVGHKAMNACVSDVCAMGARPSWAVIGLAVPPATRPDRIEDLYLGLTTAARALGVTLVGGDTVAAPALSLSLTAIGIAEVEPVTRAGARPGDLLAVTGSLGGAAAGLALLRHRAEQNAAAMLVQYPELASAHRRGRARMEEGAALARAGARAMIDVSDGLAQDAGHVAKRSGCGVTVRARAIPYEPGVDDVERWLGLDRGALPASGGDDYELAVALAPEDVESAAAAIAPTPLTVVGHFTSGAGVVVEDVDLLSPGWDHFR